MAQKEMISIHQFIVLVILITIGDAILVLPATVTEFAKQDAWISTILALVFGLVIVYLFLFVGQLYPKLNLVQYSAKILGKWLGAIVSVFYLGYLFLSAAAHVRELGDFVTTHILTQTPIQIIHFMFIFMIIMIVRSGLEPLARTGELLFPITVFFLIVLFVLVLPHIHIHWIQPILANGIKPMLQGSFVATAFPFMELAVFLMVLPSIHGQKKVKKAFFIGTAIGGLVLILAVLLCVLILGESATTRNIYPTFTLARVIQVGQSIQRIEGLIAIIWTITAYLKISLYTYALHIGLAHLLKLDGYRILTFPIGMILFAAAILVSPNITYFINIISYYWPFYDLTVAVFLPLILIVVFAIRKKIDSA